VFLDEIGEMNAELQTKLLRVLQQREVFPVGATRPVPIDVQVRLGFVGPGTDECPALSFLLQRRDV